MIVASAANHNVIIEDGDVLVVTQKIVSKAEGRVVPGRLVRGAQASPVQSGL